MLPALRKALQVLTDRHSSLRTAFGERDAQPVQVIHPQCDVALQETDARAWTEDQLYRKVSAEAYRPFDLQTGPLFRGTVFTRSDKDHVLLFAVHHIIGDFWSLILLMSDLRRIYPPGDNGGQLPLTPLSSQYADYVRWQQKLLAGAEGQRLWEYWQQQLAGELPVLNLP